MGDFYNELMRWLGRMGPQAWLFTLIGVLIVGLICMKGFGSRDGY